MGRPQLKSAPQVGKVAQDAILRIRRGWAEAQDNILRHLKPET
jgi:hypothetical protein